MKLFTVTLTIPLRESVMGLPDEGFIIENAGFETGPLSGLSLDIFYCTDHCVLYLDIETEDESVTQDMMNLIDSEVYVGRAHLLAQHVVSHTSSRLLRKVIDRLEWSEAHVSDPVDALLDAA